MERRILNVCARVMQEVYDGIHKHGTWDDYSWVDMDKAILNEMDEATDAAVRMDITGNHGTIRELIQVCACQVKRIVQMERRLKHFCEDGHEWFGECLPAVCPRCKRPAIGMRRERL